MPIVVKDAGQCLFPRHQARLQMDKLLTQVKKKRAWTHSAHQVVRGNLLTVSADLWLLGMRTIEPRNLGGRHLTSLVGLWQQGAVDAQGRQLRKPLSRKSASHLWTALGHWCEAVGKKGMRPDFRQAWPQEPPGPLGTQDEGSTAPAIKGRNGALLLQQVDDQTYQALLKLWVDAPGRKLHYWLARAVRELGLSVGEAVRFAPRSALQAGGASIVVTKWAATSQRVVQLDTPDKLALVEGIVAHLKQTHQSRLCWPRGDSSDAVPSLEAAEAKFRKAVSYAVRRIESAQAKPSTQLEEAHQ